VSPSRTVDETFLALPLAALTVAALSRAVDLGCEHADIRVERIRTQTISLRDARPESFTDGEDLGLAVRVVHEGTWGFAAGVVLTAAEAVRLAEEAVAVATVAAAINSDRVELAPEPVHADGMWVSDYEIDPFGVADSEKSALLIELSEQLMAADGVEHVQSSCMHVKEQKYYADTAGTRTRQQRVRIHPEFTALTVDRATGQFESMRTLAPPVGKGWEYLTAGNWDWRGELAEIPELLREKTKAPSVEAGRYDLVVDPSNLFLTIHESIGHATELDRALGYEAAYAGTSFATVDKLGSLQYGSPQMNVTGDRTAAHGLSTVGWDDEGVAGQQWDIVKDGVLVGTRWTGTWPGSGACRGPTAARSPTRPVTCPCSGWRTCRCSPPRTARRPTRSSPAWSAGSTWSATRAGRSTCSATTSSSPGSGSTGSRAAGWPVSSATSPTRPRRRTSGARCR
jgi:TldD protein